MGETKVYRNIAHLKSIDMFYFDTKTDGPTILCLHGRWGRAETWSDFIQHYGKQYRVIAPDQRGHGLSSKPLAKYTSAEMAEDIIELLDSLKIESVILAGHSMGGSIAAYLAAVYSKYIEAVAILDKSAAVDTFLPEPAEHQKLPLNELRDPLTKDWPLPFSSLSEAMRFIKQRMNSDIGYQYFMNSLEETVRGYQMMFSSQAMAANIAYDENWFHLLPGIKCPTLLIRSGSHEAVPDEDFTRMQSVISNCMAHEMSDPNHNVHLSNKEEFYGYFDEFLRSIKNR
ncbi:alpha/beta hydrolase [Sporolactobacillus shoreae]|uniref:Alpha/beta hydrolase n=1 Tax=Sporolactobacillus shoreae TaxID=1465501 RepID=A0A4Z0GL62_9BACL|nr:alpha/beta hydrolase [Sporolactobacillus shoreae]TGA97665.1 alpha/beta hydrolase [Sporolactobacillus shoreae]